MYFFSLRKIRAKVWHLRTASDLFDIKAYTNCMEKLYNRMWERYERGEQVTHLVDLAQPYGSISQSMFGS